MQKKLLVFFLVIMFSSFCFGQQAEIITEILESTEVTWGDMSYIAASYINVDEANLNKNSAFEFLKECNIISPNVNITEPINMAELSGLCMKTFNMKGGLFYTISKSNWYAFKELKALGFLVKNADPHSKISGFDAMNIIYNCMEYDSHIQEKKQNK